MAVLPINRISTNANQYTFTGRNDKKDSHKANPLASVPVIVMLAMAPMAEGKQPAQFVSIDSEHLTELVAQANATAPKTYEYTQKPQKEDPLGIPLFRHRKIQEVMNCTGNSKNGKLVLTDDPFGKTPNNVRYVYYIPGDYKGSQYVDPPIVTRFIYHDCGEESFAGIEVHEEYQDKQKNVKTIAREIRLDDKTAQFLIDFLAEDTKFINESGIKFIETTNPKLFYHTRLD